MKATLEKIPGKQMGLHFRGNNPRRYEELKTFIIHNTQWSDAPHFAITKPAHPFIQSSAKDYLFIEFWSDEKYWRPFVELFAKECNFTVEEIPSK